MKRERSRKKREAMIENALAWVIEYERTGEFTKKELLDGPWSRGVNSAAASRYLKLMRDRGLIEMQGSRKNASYIITLKGMDLVTDKTSAIAQRTARQQDTSNLGPASSVDEVMAEVIEEISPQPEEAPIDATNPWEVARRTTGQRALNVITLCDAVMAGDTGLNALTEARNQAIAILADLDLLETPEE